MKIATVFNSALAAIVLAGATATPVSAHGNIRQIVTYYSETGIPDEPVGQYTFYCDGHMSYWGDGGTSNYSEEYFDCP